MKKFWFYLTKLSPQFQIGRNDAYCFSFGLMRRNTGTWLLAFVFDGGCGSTYGYSKFALISATSHLTPSGRFIATKTHWFKLPFQKFFRQIGHNRFMRLFPK